MFGRAVSSRTPRSTHVCLQCARSLHTTSSVQYPRAPPGTRPTPARASATARPDRPTFARPRNVDPARPAKPSVPRFSNERSRDGPSSDAPTRFSRDRGIRDRTSPRGAERPQSDFRRSAPSRFGEDRGPRTYSPGSTARSTAPRRGSRDDGGDRATRRFSDDWSAKESRGREARPARPPPHTFRSADYEGDERTRKRFDEREARPSSRPGRDSSAGRAPSDFTGREPRSRPQYGRPDGPDKYSGGSSRFTRQSERERERDPDFAKRPQRERPGARGDSVVGGERSGGYSGFPGRSTRAVGAGGSSTRSTDADRKTSVSQFGEVDGSAEARRRRLVPSLNSRVPFSSRKSGDDGAVSRTKGPARHSTSSKLNRGGNGRTQTRESFDARVKPRWNQIPTPMPRAALEQPISRAEHKQRTARQRLDRNVRTLKIYPRFLSKSQKEEAEGWQERSDQSDKAVPKLSPSKSNGPRGLAARVIGGSKTSQEKFNVAAMRRTGLRQAQMEVNPQPSKVSQLSSIDSPTPTHTLTPETFASYKTTTPPTSSQLSYANRFFAHGKPSFLFSSAKFRELPLSLVPEVVFVGRSNVGKSSLLNALVQRTGVEIAHVSSKPGRTKTMNAFGVGGEGGVRWSRTSQSEKLEGEESEEQQRDMWIGKGGLVVLDMPGYGKASREVWGKEITKYLSQRQQLRRTFVLIDALHGVKQTDHQLLRVLRQNSVPHQIILTKVDRVLFPATTNTNFGASELVAVASQELPTLCAKILGQIREAEQEEGRGGVKVLEDVVCCSSEKEVPGAMGRKIGIDGVRWAVLAACGLESDEGGRKKIVEAEAVTGEDASVQW